MKFGTIKIGQLIEVVKLWRDQIRRFYYRPCYGFEESICVSSLLSEDKALVCLFWLLGEILAKSFENKFI